MSRRRRSSDDPEGAFAHHRRACGEMIDEMESINRSLDLLADALHGIAMQQIERLAQGDRTEDETPEGSFGYVPISLPGFLADLVDLDRILADDPDYARRGCRYRPVRFMEVGCAHGRNLAILKHSSALEWVSLHGIDISERMIELGRGTFGFEDEIQVGDAQTVDLAPYDVVYTYRPFIDDRLQRRFEKHLVKSMKVGAYLVAPLAMTVGDTRAMQALGRSGNLYKKIA